MAIPVRRRVAAGVSCLVLLLATFGYMHRTAAQSPIPPPVECREDADRPADQGETGPEKPVLCLF